MSKARYSIFAARAVFDLSLSATEVRVLAALGTYADDEGWCFPHQATLAERISVTRQTISTAIKKLVDKGYVEVETRTAPGRGKAGNKYRVVLDVKREEVADVKPRRRRVSPTSVPADVGPDHTPMSAQADVGSNIDLTTPLNEPNLLSEGGDLFGQAPPAKSAAAKRAAYSPEFEAFWRGWPKSRRELSDKRTAFRRWTDARRRWDTLTLMGAAKRYLSRPDVTKEDHRYCVLAEVFLNGKLDAAVEAFLGEVSENAGVTISESQKLDYLRVTGKWRRTWGDPPKGSEGAELT